MNQPAPAESLSIYPFGRVDRVLEFTDDPNAAQLATPDGKLLGVEIPGPLTLRLIVDNNQEALDPKDERRPFLIERVDSLQEFTDQPDESTPSSAPTLPALSTAIPEMNEPSRRVV